MRNALRAAAITVAAALSSPGAAGAQASEAEARMDALYDRMLAAPDDPALMADFARAAVAARDFEAAIATLERALIFTPNDPRLQLDLGAAYFRIGADQAARFYFEAARAGGLPPEADARAAEFLAAIDRRTARSRFSGFAMAGLTASSNANLGADDRVVRFFGVRGPFLAEDAEATADAGLRVIAELRHDYDLGGPDRDAWRTEASFYGLRFFEQEDGDIESLGFSTGPLLSLDADAAGATMRPFIGLRAVRQGHQWSYQEYGGGVEGAAPIDAAWTGFARLEGGWREYADDFDGLDAGVIRGVAGASWGPEPGVSVFVAAVGEGDAAEDDWESNVEFGARVGAALDYDPTIREAGGLWTLSGYAQATGRWYDEPDPDVDPDETRADADLRFGLAHRFRFHEGWGAQIDLDALLRRSNIANYDFTSVNGALSVVYEF